MGICGRHRGSNGRLTCTGPASQARGGRRAHRAWRGLFVGFGDMTRRPLDRLGSIKLKLGVAIVIAGAVSAVVSTVGFRLGLPIWLRPVIAVAIALGLVQVLARGMTSPLREMADAARKMADGDWSQHVSDTSADEVGDLARAFNDMAAQLAAVDRMRRDLVANVSHELRTPIAALQAPIENPASGGEQAAPG